MKLLVLLIGIAGIGYFLSQNSGTEVNIDSYQALLDKVETGDVTKEEVKAGANLAADFFCNDVAFQVSGGNSVSSCLDNVEASKERCESRIFANSSPSFDDKAEVISIVKRYISCVGISS